MAIDAAPLLILAGFAALDEQMRRRQAPEAPPWFGRPIARVVAKRGRGRAAQTPAQIPARGWKDILLRVGREFTEDQIPLISAGVTFFSVLAVFPGLAALVSIYGLFADTGPMTRSLAALSHVLPGGAVQVLGDDLARLSRTGGHGGSLTFLIGLVTAIWSANGAVRSLIVGLNVAYEVREQRSFLSKTLISLVFTLGFLVFGMAATVVLGVGPAVRASLGSGPAFVLDAASWPGLLLAFAIGLALFYRFGPSRAPVRLRWISWGSAAAVILWLIVSAAFTLYAANFGHYNRTYGSLGAAVGFMTWIWLSCMVVLAGAELNAEIERQTAVVGARGR